jgi:hypothetical protein
MITFLTQFIMHHESRREEKKVIYDHIFNKMRTKDSDDLSHR